MKETKYRAWDGENMYYLKDGYYITIFDHPRKVSACLYSVADDCLISKTDRGLILLQFTGLLDKNGKEIYEGDIIKHNDNKYIAWDTDNFGLMFIKVETFSNDRVLRMSHRYRDYNWAYNVKKYIEVIGNIHED